MAKPELNAVIIERIQQGSELFVWRVAPNGWELPKFEPGQFAVLGLPGSAPRCEGSKPEEKPAEADKFIQRAYSIASSPLVRDYLEFYIVLVREGALTPRMFGLKVGDRVWLSPKISGQFTLADVPSNANLVFVATGTGLAPYISMLHTYLPWDQKRRIAVLHGIRESQDLGYRSELAIMQRLAANFNYFPIVSRPHLEKVPWKGTTGHVQDIWKRKILDERWGFHPTAENTHFFLCGAPGMIQDFQKLLEAEGFKEHTRKEPGQIHIEKYW
ncbi:MAG: ferredoxin--NADP reductase [Deltaproteobacteria bacterium]|nr:ferredoxin--NADP reductase [Deltaproteobacteria bacterium]